jgi:1-acyl-sn-glycerol-3-phosphate acyltransferase
MLRRWARRSITLPAIHVVWIVCTALAPALFLLAAARDAIGGAPRLWARTRTVAFFLCFLWLEVLGLWFALALWLVSGVWLGVNRTRFVAWNYALQRWWTGSVFSAARWAYSMPFESEGVECATDGPYLLFVRHASTADTVVPASVIANEFSIQFRYVLKNELLWDPCLDVVGKRLPNAFVDRTGSMRDRELAAIGDLVEDLGPRDGILIYPEGTRYTPAKHARALEKLRGSARKTIVSRAERLEHVLPPRPGGPLALLAAAPSLDVVFFAHTGLEGAVNFRRFIRGGLVGQTIRVKVWRVPAAEIPTSEEERLEWLFDQWLRVDTWLAQQAANVAPPLAS